MIELGRYRHYKGTEYQVIGVGLHTATLKEMVIYYNPANSDQFWVRPLTMFIESVTVNGQKKPRFMYIQKEGDV